MTGKLPPAHGVRDNHISSLSTSTPTYAAWLASRGYDTAAFVSAVVLERRYGLNAGFAVYDDAMPGEEPERSGRETIDRALQWLANRRDSRRAVLSLDPSLRAACAISDRQLRRRGHGRRSRARAVRHRAARTGAVGFDRPQRHVRSRRVAWRARRRHARVLRLRLDDSHALDLESAGPEACPLCAPGAAARRDADDDRARQRRRRRRALTRSGRGRGSFALHRQGHRSGARCIQRDAAAEASVRLGRAQGHSHVGAEIHRRARAGVVSMARGSRRSAERRRGRARRGNAVAGDRRARVRESVCRAATRAGGCRGSGKIHGAWLHRPGARRGRERPGARGPIRSGRSRSIGW